MNKIRTTSIVTIAVFSCLFLISLCLMIVFTKTKKDDLMSGLEDVTSGNFYASTEGSDIESSLMLETTAEESDVEDLSKSSYTTTDRPKEQDDSGTSENMLETYIGGGQTACSLTEQAREDNQVPIVNTTGAIMNGQNARPGSQAVVNRLPRASASGGKKTYNHVAVSHRTKGSLILGSPVNSDTPQNMMSNRAAIANVCSGRIRAKRPQAAKRRKNRRGPTV